MIRRLFNRLFHSMVTLLILSLVVFVLGRVSGDPVMLLLPQDATQEDIEAIRKSLALDKPMLVQYTAFLSKAVRGDFGISLRAKIPATQLLLERLPNSLKLAGIAFFLTLVTAIPLGVIAAVKKGSPIDTVARSIAVFGQTIPGFWLAIMLIEFFSGRLRWLPTSGIGGFEHYILPASVASFLGMAGIMRLMRSSVLDALDSEYIKMARAKGVSETAVIWKHALKNALITPITFAGMYLAMMVTHLVVIETVFAWPGLGRLAYDAIIMRDFPVMQAVVLFGAVVIIIVNIFVDLIYVYVDPRVRSL